MDTRARLLTALLIAMTTVSPGCSRRDRLPTYPVTGKVTFPDGNALPGGRIVFQSMEQSGLQAWGLIQDDGTFSLRTYEPGDGAVSGKHRIAVNPPRKNPQQPPTHPIHVRLMRPETSGLTRVVSDREANFFEIQVEHPEDPGIGLERPLGDGLEQNAPASHTDG